MNWTNVTEWEDFMVTPNAQKAHDRAKLNLKIIIALNDDLTASEISTRAGLSVNVLGKFLRGETSINYQNLLAVCDVLGIPIGVIDSDQQITPARIHLYRMLSKYDNAAIKAALKNLDILD